MQVPLSGGSVELLAWHAVLEVLEERGIETTIIRMPRTFRLGHRDARAERHGHARHPRTYGTFAFFTSEPFAFGGRRCPWHRACSRRIDGVVNRRWKPGQSVLIKRRRCSRPSLLTSTRAAAL